MEQNSAATNRGSVESFIANDVEVTATNSADALFTTLTTLYKLCEDYNYTPYFKFVINPSSFIQTCYNIKIVRFLINEGLVKAAFYNSHVLIKPIKSRVHRNSRTRSVKRKKTDCVSTINKHEWEYIIRTLEITETQLTNIYPAVSETLNEHSIMNLFELFNRAMM